METEEIRSWKLGVLGAGQMGYGIAECAAQNGFSVINVDLFPQALETAKSRTKQDMEKLVSKGKKSPEESDAVLKRITYGDSLEMLGNCDAIIEAVPENLELKRSMFQQLDRLTKKDALLASNTSAIAISALSASMGDPSRCVGMHFFCPAPVMRLVEIVPGCATSKDTVERAFALTQALGKTPGLAPETPGFLVNRMLVPMQNEAAFLVMEGSAPQDVDNAMKLGANLPMGPLELTDYVGVDVMYNTMLTLYENYHDSKYRPCPLLANMVAAGWLGRKSGRGFYSYDKEAKKGML